MRVCFSATAYVNRSVNCMPMCDVGGWGSLVQWLAVRGLHDSVKGSTVQAKEKQYT